MPHTSHTTQHNSFETAATPPHKRPSRQTSPSDGAAAQQRNSSNSLTQYGTTRECTFPFDPDEGKALNHHKYCTRGTRARTHTHGLTSLQSSTTYRVAMREACMHAYPSMKVPHTHTRRQTKCSTHAHMRTHFMMWTAPFNKRKYGSFVTSLGGRLRTADVGQCCNRGCSGSQFASRPLLQRLLRKMRRRRRRPRCGTVRWYLIG